MGGKLHKCEAVKCVQSKGYEGCWECIESENCERLNFVRRGYGETINRTFQTIKEKGFDEVKSHGNKYYAWQKTK